MSAIEVIEEIKQLPREEQRKVADFIYRMESQHGVSEEFKHLVDDVFSSNDELFRKLAK
jgi:hypothetical protein